MEVNVFPFLRFGNFTMIEANLKAYLIWPLRTFLQLPIFVSSSPMRIGINNYFAHDWTHSIQQKVNDLNIIRSVIFFSFYGSAYILPN